MSLGRDPRQLLDEPGDQLRAATAAHKLLSLAADRESVIQVAVTGLQRGRNLCDGERNPLHSLGPETELPRHRGNLVRDIRRSGAEIFVSDVHQLDNVEIVSS